MLASLLIAALIAVPEILLYPILIATSGMIASIIGTATIGSKNIKDVMKPLNRSFYISAAIAIGLNFAFTKLFMGDTPIAYALFGRNTQHCHCSKRGSKYSVLKWPVQDMVQQMMQARMKL